MSRIAVDLDGTLTLGDHSLINYFEMRANKEAIAKINKLADKGHEIFIYTARHWIEHEKVSEWLDSYGVKYEHLECSKLRADLYIDNNSKRMDEI